MKKSVSELDQLRRWYTDLVILSLFHRQPLHGYGVFLIFQEQGLPDFQMRRTTLYAIIHRLERKRWITGQWETGWNRRHQFVYKLTQTGGEILDRRLAQRTRFMATVERLLQHTPLKPSSGQSLKMNTLSNRSHVMRRKKPRPDTVMEAVLKGSLTRHFPLRKVIKAPY